MKHLFIFILLMDVSFGITIYRKVISTDGTTNVSALVTAPGLDWETLVALDLIPGAEIINKTGRNPDIDTASVPEDVWNGGGTYPGFPSSAGQIECFSSDAADTAAGTGARTIVISGALDQNYTTISPITVTLNGTTPVSVPTVQVIRAHTARVSSAGSSGVNAGEITCRQISSPSVIFFRMPIGYNQTNMGGYTVPAGYTGLVRSARAAVRGSTTSSADGNFWIRNFGEVFRSRRPLIIPVNGAFDGYFTGGLIVREKSDIIPRIISVSANNTEVVFSYDIILVKNQ